MSRKTTFALTIGLSVLCGMFPVGRGYGQDIGDMFFSAGTTAEDTYGRHWAYIIWQATDPSALLNRSFAIYSKTGDAASASAYSRVGVASVQTEPRVIRMLLSRASNVGEDLSKLETTIDSLFQEILPDASLSLEEKISEVIRGGLDDAALYQNIIFLARSHPSISASLGHGCMAQITGTGKTTFEIRSYDAAADQAGAVMGRVTVEAGAPAVLPAPVDLAELIEESPKGHLNVRLRWSTPDSLRRKSLLNHGFGIYRMTRDYAEDGARLYHTSPPSASALTNAVAVDSNDVARLNEQPVLIDERNADTNTYYFIDDNDRFATGGESLTNGAEYYYFITALDLLGRDGDVSTGMLATVCDRMPPRPPRNVKAQNTYAYAGGIGEQDIRIVWDQNASTNGDTTVNYYVYRWRTISNMHLNASNPTNNLISGAIPHQEGIEKRSYIDTTLDTNDLGKTYWYSVRAEDDGAGGGNLSGNSAPAYAVLRDREGPPLTNSGSVYITAEDISVSYMSNTTRPRNGAPFQFRTICDRSGSEVGVEWAEFRYKIGPHQAEDGTNAMLIARRHYRSGAAKVFGTLNIDKGGIDTITFFCRAGSIHGKVSAYDAVQITYPLTNEFEEITFAAVATYATVEADASNDVHITEGDGTDSSLDRITGVIPITGDTREWRVYRRVNFGKLTLIDQGQTDSMAVSTTNFSDYASAVLNGGRICYYYQLFDEHGNPGALTMVDCITATASRALRAPVLAPIEPVGTSTNPAEMSINWFCPPPGVVRFEVAISDDPDAEPNVTSTNLSDNTAGATNSIFVDIDGETNENHFGIYQTGRVGGNFGTTNSPDFSVDVEVEMNTPYLVMVRSVGEGGRRSQWSNVEEFTWYLETGAGTNVAWPARPLPYLQTALFHERFEAAYLAASNHVDVTNDCVGIRIGEIPGAVVEGQGGLDVTLNVQTNPVSYLFDNENDPDGNTVIPFVLYRYQTTNAILSRVSGDIIQVSPLMEDIAYQEVSSTVLIRDPYILVIDAQTNNLYDIYMLDTQPVIRGASYKYLVTRFDDKGELDRIIPSNEITIP